MRNFNWLVKLIFYKHNEKPAIKNNLIDSNAIFYDVGYIDQLHTNLCVNACENMLYHFGGKPISTMIKNPRSTFDGLDWPNIFNFHLKKIKIDNLRTYLSKNGPFILKLPLRYDLDHSIVVIGYANNNIIYHDPMTGSNKMLSISELNEVNEVNDPESFIQIATANFFPKEKIDNRRKELNEKPHDILPKKYQTFFTLNRMEDPCKAIIDFLNDYSSTSFWTRRTHKHKVKQFVEQFRNEKDIRILLSKLDSHLKSTSKETKGELYNRLLTIEKMMNLPVSNNRYFPSCH